MKTFYSTYLTTLSIFSVVILLLFPIHVVSEFVQDNSEILAPFPEDGGGFGYYMDNPNEVLIARDSDDEASSTTVLPTNTLGPPSKSITGSPATTPIQENLAVRFVIKPGEYHIYQFSNFTKRTNQTFYITGNLCIIPDSDPSGNNVRVQMSTDLSSLTSSSPSSSSPNYYSSFFNGFLNITNNLTLSSSQNSIYFVIMAPTLSQYPEPPANYSDTLATPNSNDTWTYEVGISTQRPIHSYFEEPNLYLVDTDFAHALFTTGDMVLAEKEGNNDEIIPSYNTSLFYTNTSTYYNVYIFPQSVGNSLSKKLGGSYCAISDSQNVLLNRGNSNISISTRGDIGLPKIQYFFSGLNISSNYTAFLSESNSHGNTETNPQLALAGGSIFGKVEFETKREQNCQIIFDLDLCHDVAYAVPGNTTAFTPKQLGDVYDSKAKEWYSNFIYSMQQVPCDNVSEVEKYSILRSCSDCQESYREWLCAVTIPRCMDYSSVEDYLAPRVPRDISDSSLSNNQNNEQNTIKSQSSTDNVNHSRAFFIDNLIRPGPYKELLPCIGLCNAIMQDCPSQFEFSCPEIGNFGFDGYYMTDEGDGRVTCNYPGAVYKRSSASGLFNYLKSSIGIYYIQFFALSIIFFVL